MDRVILHCDCNSFFASVETLENPALARVPMAVTGDPENRHGIVLAKNEIAKAAGVETAETIFKAKEKCPGLVCVPPHYHKYSEISRRVNAIYLDYTDLVDPFGIDESFLDLTGSMHLFPMTPAELADVIRARVRQEIGITISVGVSFCRVFAKLGSDYKKPDATTVLDRAHYRDVAYPLPVGAMLFAGRKSVEALRRLGIVTIGELAAADRKLIASRLGEPGDTLWRYANGLDEEPVRSYYERTPPKSISNGMTFRRDIVGEAEIRAGVSALTDEVAERLRAENLKACVVQVQLKFPDFRTVQRQRTRETATWLRQDIIADVMALIRESTGTRIPIRAITVGVSGLVAPDEVTEQLDMFGERATESDEKKEAVEQTMGRIRDRFGRDSICLGCFDNAEIGIAGEKERKKTDHP